jgi:hypothetical protein
MAKCEQRTTRQDGEAAGKSAKRADSQSAAESEDQAEADGVPGPMAKLQARLVMSARGHLMAELLHKPELDAMFYLMLTSEASPRSPLGSQRHFLGLCTEACQGMAMSAT